MHYRGTVWVWMAFFKKQDHTPVERFSWKKQPMQQAVLMAMVRFLRQGSAFFRTLMEAFSGDEVGN